MKLSSHLTPILMAAMASAGLARIALVLLLASQMPMAAAAEAIVTPAFKQPAPDALVVVLPPLRSADSAIDNALTTQVLRSRLALVPFKVATLSEENCMALLTQAVVAVSADAGKGAPLPRAELAFKAMSALSQAICEEVKCHLVLQTKVVQRQAKLQGRYADWDGVRIPVRDLIAVDRAFLFEMEGSTPAWSVEVVAFDADGKLAFLTHGGLALAFERDKQRSSASPNLLRLRDEAAIRVAVDAALAHLTFQK